MTLRDRASAGISICDDATADGAGHSGGGLVRQAASPKTVANPMSGNPNPLADVLMKRIPLR
jgi:hypothetical protein